MIELSQEYEYIAEAMLETRGNLKEASRNPNVDLNAMALRAVVKDNPSIRQRYQELLAEEMQDKGLHIAERIMKMAELQEEAYDGGSFMDVNGEEQSCPPDINSIINLSKEISRLIAEGKGAPMSNNAMVVIASKEDATELLAGFLSS